MEEKFSPTATVHSPLTVQLVGGDGGGTRLRRSSSSYPNLRQESLWENRDNMFRYFNDYEVKLYRTSAVAEHFQCRAWRNKVERDEPDTPVKVIPMDKYKVSTTSPPSTPAPPPPSPLPPPTTSLKCRRSFNSVPQNKKFEKQRNEDEFNETRSPQLPPLPSPSPIVKSRLREEKREIILGKKSGVTKEITTSIASLYKSQRKRKKKVKTRNIYDRGTENSLPEQS
ncbi:formin-like protein 20 [Forsythia ovata]|uniref:Formin-like protein 20 n=1 Tax=Forsythia ovata TaxID=205694 RepID=A0ABD1PIT2_9LAMI